MEVFVRAVPIAIALLLAASPAVAFDTGKLGQGGSLPFDDLMPLIGQSAQLKREVDQALAEVKKKPEDVICSGKRFAREWVHLGGSRVSPYACDFGAKWLQIRATVQITDRGGRAFETITPAAMKNASKVSETGPMWKWTTEEPPDGK
jgi:hypothetical protein